jgi:uncharacterized LabA/DUF88 family protein
VRRVITYIDGFNLYFGLRDKGWRRYLWLNPRLLGSNLLKADQTLVGTKYFTARIAEERRDPDKHRRQAIFLEAIETLPATSIYYGHYLRKPQSCHTCGERWMSHEEKMTDVQIAVQLLGDAVDDGFDVALVISADSDLAPPISAVRARFPKKRVIVVCPPDRKSQRLESVAHAYFTLGRKVIQDSQFPDEVVKPNGHVLRRPAKWRGEGSKG